MALNRGALFSSALFAGRLFGEFEQDPEQPEVAASSGGGHAYTDDDLTKIAARKRRRRNRALEAGAANRSALDALTAGDALEGESRDFWLRAFGVVPEVVEPQEASQPDLQAEQRPHTPADEVARGDEDAQAPGFEINGDTFAQAREAIERIREQSILAGKPDAGRVAPADPISDDEDEAAILALLACYME